MMKSAAIAVLLFLFAGAPLLAQDRNIQLTVWASRTDMQGENEFEGGFETHFEEGSALGASVNWFAGSHLSVEGSVFGLSSEADLHFEGTPVIDLGSLNLTAFTAGGQFHVLGRSRFDPYVGAGIAYVIGDEFFTPETQAAGLGRIELENEVTYYVNVGLGFQFTPGFGVAVDARYIPYETTSRSTVTGGEEDLELAPRIYSAGLRLRF